MTIAGQLSVTASDDPRFKAGDSIGVVIDAGLDISVVQNIEVSAPAPVPVVSVPVVTSSTDPGAASPVVGTDNPNSTPPATP